MIRENKKGGSHFLVWNPNLGIVCIWWILSGTCLCCLEWEMLGCVISTGGVR